MRLMASFTDRCNALIVLPFSPHANSTKYSLHRNVGMSVRKIGRNYEVEDQRHQYYKNYDEFRVDEVASGCCGRNVLGIIIKFFGHDKCLLLELTAASAQEHSFLMHVRIFSALIATQLC